MIGWNSRFSWAFLSPTILVAVSVQGFLGHQWPSTVQWQSFNKSLGGRLEMLRPWAAVCYSEDPLYDPAKCQTVLAGYDNDTIREDVPSALLWPNWEACGYGNGCSLNYFDPQVIVNETCHQGTTPLYSIAIENAQDASTVVKWAVDNGVRLTVKSTGHDFLGRSAAPGTLQVNVHRLQSLEYVPQFVPEGSDEAPVVAITMGGGVRMVDVWTLAEEKNVSVVMGSCPMVGAGGFFQNGGHGVLVPLLGLAAEQVLEYEIITADAQIRKINAVQDSDLFWAARGGGAGSWGIITSVTIKTYPSMTMGASQLVVEPNATQNETELAIAFTTIVASYSSGWINKGISIGFVQFEDQYQLSLNWPSQVVPLSVLFPFFDELRSLSANYTVTSNHTNEIMFASVPQTELTAIAPIAEGLNAYGAPLQISSRLIPEASLSTRESARQVAEAIWAGINMINAVIIEANSSAFGLTPLEVSASTPPALKANVNETGSNPALYEAVWETTFAASWQMNASHETQEALISAVEHAVDPLTEMGIIGSYQGDGNAYEENWKETFFGYKYSNLTSIKRKYDPTNFFNSLKGIDWIEDLPQYECY